MSYDDTMKMAAARELYFERSGLDPGYERRWVRLQAGRFVFGFPNLPSRRRAVRLHDLHHVLTGYETSWTGEAEISGFEIGSGCGDYAFAWAINLQGLVLGQLIAPRRTFRAFVRGRHATNLYHLVPAFDPALLERTVGELRAAIRVAGPEGEPRAADRGAFVLWSLAGLVFALAPVAALGVLLRWML